MVGSNEPESVELSSDDLIEVAEDRASILSAAATAQNIAMLTGTHGVVAPPLLRPRVRLPAADEITRGALPDPDDAELGRLRAFVAGARAGARGEDPVGELRAQIELARAELERGNLDSARKAALAAAEVSPHGSIAHAMLRGLHLHGGGGRETAPDQLVHVDALVASATPERARADWLCERARLIEAAAGPTEASVAVWGEAVALAPDHAGALYGLEVALDKTARHAEHAEVIARLAALVNASAGGGADAAGVAAWLHVERALLLDRRVGETASARAALEAGLALAPGLGPVRAASVDHAVRHRDEARLGELLETEAALEPDRTRAAGLELDAALAQLRAGVDRAHVTRVLERAHGRAPTTPLLDARIAEELVRLHEADGRHAEALRARQAALKGIDDSREEVVALREIASSAERAGEIDAAVLALEQARVLEPEDPTLLADLDALFVAAKRHEARSILWMREAARVDDAGRKANALLAAADSARAGGRATEAARHREAAWLTAPTAPGVYDAIAERLAPVAPGAVEERVRLYEQAAFVTKDPARKVHLLEKIAWLHDDIAGDAARAVKVYEEVLRIEPGRLSGILGLASAATRAGDAGALARALTAQAAVTTDPAARGEIELRAAEALATIDPERALALASRLAEEPGLFARASEVVTQLHLRAERWERAAEMLARRGELADGAAKVALVLAEAAVLLGRLRAPERALDALARLAVGAAGAIDDDAAVRAASLRALEALGDEDKLRVGLSRLTERAGSPIARARLLLRAAELDAANGRDADAVAAYVRAREALPSEPLIRERLWRLGARADLGEAARGNDLASPLAVALRTIDAEREGDASATAPSAEPLLATGGRDIATLRLAERLARRAGSAPQLANALAMMAESYPSGIVASRALEGLALLVAWTLPASDDAEPWEKLLALGCIDTPGIDMLVARSHARVLAGDAAALRASIAALGRRLASTADDTERLALHLDRARLLRRAGALPEAAADGKQALAADPSSLSAATLLAELAAELDDGEAAIAASKALARIVTDPKAQAAFLRDAADLSAARRDAEGAADLFEQALRADPEDVQVASRLAAHQRARGAFEALGRSLREALDVARSPEAIVPIASELAEVARKELKDPMLAIAALERIREVSPSHVPALFLLAELFLGQRAWDKALAALADTVRATNERGDKLVALVGRASIYRRVLNQPKLAEAELRAALELDPHDARAVRGLLDLGPEIAGKERAVLLERLVITDSTPSDRLQALLELAEARRVVGDSAGAEGALVEAAALSPDLRMLERVRAAVGKDTETLARVLSRAVARAHEGGQAIDPTWLIGLGQIELELGRHDAAIDRFEEALRGDDSRDDARVFLARALAARGRHELAAAALAPILLGTSSTNASANGNAGATRRMPIDAGLVRLLESSLSGAGRATEQWVARELRAVAGDLAPNEQAELDRRMSNLGYAEGLSADSLRKSVMPGSLGRHPIWDVALLAGGLAGKLARVGVAEQGASTRDRVKPRAAHPVRTIFDRVLHAFELEEVELAVSSHITIPVLACEDVPWVIVPAAFDSCPDAYAIAALARPMTRIALGVPWLGALEAHDVLAILVAFARQVAPGFSARPQERIEPLVADYEQRARKAIDRRRRRALEELEPMLDHAVPVEEKTFREAVACTEARAAFLLSGSLRASLDAVAPSDAGLMEALRVPGPPSLAAVFGSASSRDLASFALSGETTALRRTLGTA